MSKKIAKKSNTPGVFDLLKRKNDEGIYPASGSTNKAFNNNILDRALHTFPCIDFENRDELSAKAEILSATMLGISPRDEIEGMLATQMVAAHNAAMHCYALAVVQNQTPEGRDLHLKHAAKLSRAYSQLLESLNRHRGKEQQKMIVEHVHVHEGGQAIVGNVNHPQGGGVRKKSKE